MPSVFISYSHTDKTITDYIGAELRARDADVFIGYHTLDDGENLLRLGREIESRDFFVLLLSPRSVVSKWVQAEAAWALRSNKPIIPVLLEPASLRDFFFLVSLEQIDFTRWSVDGKVNDAVEKLAKIIGLPAEPVGASPSLEVQIDHEISKPIERERKTSPPDFRESDLYRLFDIAKGIADKEPEQGIFLYRQLVENVPNEIRDSARNFIILEEARLKPLRVKKILEQARLAMQNAAWESAYQNAQDILLLDPANLDAHEISQICSSQLKSRKSRVESPRLQVFLCHAIEDKASVRELYNQLLAKGVKPWLDEKDILPGQDWDREIKTAVGTSDVIVVCLSRKAVEKRGYVQKEIRFALDIAGLQPEGITFIIPVKLEDCTVPDSLKHLQWVNLYEKNGFEYLLKSLRHRASTLDAILPS